MRLQGFDHVRPRFVPDGRENRGNLYENWGFTGFRIPGVAVSPYARGGNVNHMPITHESILKLISYKFSLGHLNKRHRYATNIGRSFNWKNPKFDPPRLPDPQTITAVPCSAQSGSLPASSRPKPHDLVGLETSGYLDRLGYEVKPAAIDQVFREPDGVKKSLRDSAR